MTADLGKHAISETTKAVSKYMNSGSSGLMFDTIDEVLRLHHCRLQISFDQVGQMFGASDPSVRLGLAALAEYVSAECLELAGNIRDDVRPFCFLKNAILGHLFDSQSDQLSVRHLEKVIAEDEELRELRAASSGCLDQYLLRAGFLGMSVRPPPSFGPLRPNPS